MINSVRNTVLFLLNKDNRGYIAPSEFDYFAKQAQLEIFENYFSDYSRAVLLQNQRKRALGYGDSVVQIQNKIDLFATSATLQYTDVGSVSVGGEDDYFSFPSNLYKLINLTYNGKVLQEIPKHKFDMIVNSNLSSPTVTYPVFKREGVKVFARPLSIYYTASTPQNSEIALKCNYIKKPSDPHWGYNTISSDPVYNSDTSVDFEISSSDDTELVIKICKFAGLSIREKEVLEVTNAIETQEFQKQNT